VLDSPVPDFATAAMTQMERLGAPGGPLRRYAVRVAERLTGARFAEVRTLDLLPKLTCPALVIAPADDVLLAGTAGDALREAVAASPAGGGRGAYWDVPGAGHLLALPTDPTPTGRDWPRSSSHCLARMPSRVIWPTRRKRPCRNARCRPTAAHHFRFARVPPRAGRGIMARFPAARGSAPRRT
jgi:hypothetical protein